MNDYPQDPNNPYNQQAPDPDQPVYEYEEVQEEPYYEEYVEAKPPKPFKRWLPHLIISGVSLLIAAGMAWNLASKLVNESLELEEKYQETRLKGEV